MGKCKDRKTVQQKPTDTSSKKRIIESYACNGTFIKSGDCVLVRVGDRSKPDVAKVNQVLENEEGEVTFGITWYIWPEDTEQGRRAFHGKSELFSSSWSDIVSSESIGGKCTVHTVEDYQNLEAGPCDFFSRTRYNHAKKAVDPKESLPVYCLCRSPYNPDYPVVLCDKCEDWFHPKCVGIDTMSEVNSLREQSWCCPKCRPSESAT